MEEVGNEWRCPTCRKKEKLEAASEKTKNELEQKLEAKLQKENEKQLQQEKKQALKKSGAKKKLGAPGSKKRPGSAMSNDGKEEKVRLLKNIGDVASLKYILLWAFYFYAFFTEN